MDCRTLLQLYEIDQERRAAIRKEQQQWFLICEIRRQRPITHYWARLLIGFGIALQRYGQAIKQRAVSPSGTGAATPQELHLSR